MTLNGMFFIVDLMFFIFIINCCKMFIYGTMSAVGGIVYLVGHGTARGGRFLCTEDFQQSSNL